MIVDAVLGVLFGAVAFVMLLFPESVVPSFASEGGALDTGIQTIAGYLVPVSGWVPFDALAVVIPAVSTCLLFSLTVRGIRVAMSFVSGGGGEA